MYDSEHRLVDGLLARLGLLGHHEVHGGEEIGLGAGDQAVSGLRETVGGFLGSLGGQASHLEKASSVVGDCTSPPGHADNGEGVKEGLHVLPLASQWPPPRNGVWPLSEILVVLQLEACIAYGLKTIGDLDHVANAITLLDTQPDLPVLEVVVVVVIRHQPFVHTEHTAWLQYTENLAVNTNELGGMYGSLNGVNGVKTVVREVHLLSIPQSVSYTDLIQDVKTTAIGTMVRTMKSPFTKAVWFDRPSLAE